MTLKRRKVEDGLYIIIDENDVEVAEVYEAGVSGYRWRVSPRDRSIKGWDAQALGQAIVDLTATLGNRQAERHGHPSWSHAVAYGPCTRKD